MEKASYMRFKGSRHLRQNLLLSTLSHRAIIIEVIRSNETPPGLRSHEISLLRLIEKISDDCRVEINETGITNNSKDPSVDTFRHITFHILEHFGVPKEGLQLKIESRGSPPLGGGEVVLGVPPLPRFSAVIWIDEGLKESEE